MYDHIAAQKELDFALKELNKATNYESFARLSKKVFKSAKTLELEEFAREKVRDAIIYLESTNPDFKATRRKVFETIRKKRQYSKAIRRAEATIRDIDEDIDTWIEKHRFNKRSFIEAKVTSDDYLGCPNPKCKDYGNNMGNIMNGIPTCMRCWHKLVPKSKFKNYNRAYWRNWNRGERGKKY